MFLKRLLIVISIVFATCFAAGKYFDDRYKKNWSTLFFDSIDTLLDKTKNYDIVMLGNSRFHFGLNPFYIDSITQLKSYNFGIGGAGPASLQLYSSLYLQNHPAPKYVLLNSDVSMIVEEEGLYTQFHLLYYLQSNFIYNYLKPYHPSLALAKYLPFTKYCFMDEYNRRSIFRKKIEFTKIDHNIYKGFFNNHQLESSEGDIVFGMQTIVKPVSDSSIQMVKSVVQDFTRAGSNVILVSAPVNNNLKPEDRAFFAKTDSVFEDIARQYGAIYFNANKEWNYDDKYFVDELHLNEPGTRIFSRRVGAFLKNIYSGK